VICNFPLAKWPGNASKVASQHYLISRDHHFEDVVGGGDSIPSAGADGVQANRIECDSKCEAISANRIELLTRAVILVAGMKLAEAERAAAESRLTVRAAARIYHAIGTRITRRGYEVLDDRKVRALRRRDAHACRRPG